MGARARGQDVSRPASAIDRLRLFRAYVGALRAVWLPAYVAASYTAWSPGSGSPQVASLTAFAVIGGGPQLPCWRSAHSAAPSRWRCYDGPTRSRQRNLWMF